MAEIVVAVAGDSISAGSPLWDAVPAVRERIPAPDERSQWQWWASRADARLEFRTTAVYGEANGDELLGMHVVRDGADVLVVQGGINDVVQRRPLEEAARNLEAMLERGEADIRMMRQYELIDRVKSNPKLMLAPVVSGNWWLEFPGFHDPKSPFHDKRVRQAISLAVDREAMNQAECDGMGGDAAGAEQRQREAARQLARLHAVRELEQGERVAVALCDDLGADGGI